MLPIVIAIFAVIAVLFGVCLAVFIKSYKNYSDEDEDMYEDEAPVRRTEKPSGGKKADVQSGEDGPAPPRKEPPREAAKEAKSAPKPEPKAEVKAASKPEAKPEARAEGKTAPKVEAKPEPKAEAKTAPKAETKPEAKAETKPEAKPENAVPENREKGFATRVATPEEMRILREAARAAGTEKQAPVHIDDEDEEPDAPEEKGSKLIPFITVAASVVAAVCIGVLIFVLVNSRKPQEPKLPETVAVSYEDVRIQESITGRITSPELLTSIFAASGKVEDVKVAEGDYVSKGDVIYTIDSSNLQARIDLLEERLSSIDVDTGGSRRLSVTAPAGGEVTSLRISSGSSVSSGSVIAEITAPAVHSLSVVTDAAGVEEGDKISVSTGSVNVQGTVTSVKEISPAPEDEETDEGEDDGEEADNDGETGEDEEPEPSARTHSVTITFTAQTASVGSTGTVSINGKSCTGQVVKGNASVSRVTAPAGGTVVSLKIKSGDTVSAGAAIAEIETPASAQSEANSFQAKELKLEIDQLENELENYTLKASSAGYVKKLYVKKGENAALNMTAVSIVPQDSLALQIELDAETAENMPLPAAVSFKINRSGSFPGDVWEKIDTDQVYHVTLDTVSPTDAGGYVGYIALDDEEQDIFRSEMTAKVTVTTYIAYNVPVIPAKLVKDGKVKILNANNEIEEVSVETGVTTKDGDVEIKSGLDRDDKIVTE